MDPAGAQESPELTGIGYFRFGANKDQLGYLYCFQQTICESFE